MFEFDEVYRLNSGDILDWTSANHDVIELPYQVDQFLFDAGFAFDETFPPYDGDEDDEAALDAWCAACDRAYAACTTSARLILDFVNEQPHAAFFVGIIPPAGERIDCIGTAATTTEQAAELIKTFLRIGAAGLTEEAASAYRNWLSLHYLIKQTNGEEIPIDEFSYPVLQLLKSGRTPQEIADGLTSA